MMACPMPRAAQQHRMLLCVGGEAMSCGRCHQTWWIVKRAGANLGCKRAYHTLVPTFEAGA